MTPRVLRVIVADDERPARAFLLNLLKEAPGVEVVGQAANGEEALAVIEAQQPDLALLDLQMPVLGGLDVVRHVSPAHMPLVAFVTAFDDFAIDAFDLNAIDYLLKPVEKDRLFETLERARARLGTGEPAEQRAAVLEQVATAVAQAPRRLYLDRIPVHRRNDVVLLPVRQIASVVAEGELLHLTTLGQERFTITHRLHLLEERLDPRRFLRLSRGTLASVDAITKVSPMPGGMYVATLSNGQELQVSRIQSRLLRDTLLKL
jgi:two-component system LytT family response regulator